MKLTTEIIILLISAVAFAIGFALRCALARIYRKEIETEEITHGSPSRCNNISFARSARQRSALMRRRISMPFTAQIPASADQTERNVIQCFYKLVYGMLVNGK